jgi:HPt (histidine-containing phosphotransfer) domain-containing protein
VAAIGHKEESVKERAHTLKGSSSTIGACRIARLCEQLQTGGEQGPRERTKDLARQLESELACARSVLLAIRAEGLHPARA